MAHGPATEWKKEKSEDFKTKMGLIMFGIYTPIYLAFIFICVFSPSAMSTNIGYLNVAIVFGFGLIVLAIVQALVYNRICSKREALEGDVIHNKPGVKK
jgi:uncharacterized membrane protein (DUF485 family)